MVDEMTSITSMYGCIDYTHSYYGECVVYGPVRFAPSHLGRGIYDDRFDLLLILEALLSLPKNRWKRKIGRRRKMTAILA
jgi:hypothetical protein